MSDDILDIPLQPGAAELSPAEVLSPQEAATDVLEPADTVVAPAPSAPEPTTATPPASYVDVTCPSCGAVSAVAESRRAADDFCRSCDYPLFWAVERAAPPAQEVADSGLRRLPGTAGRAALAALACPACTEPNPPAALVCGRCGADLHPAPVVEEPEPEPVFVEPEPVVEEPPNRWWVWLVVAAVLLVVGGGVLAALLL